MTASRRSSLPGAGDGAAGSRPMGASCAAAAAAGPAARSWPGSGGCADEADVGAGAGGASAEGDVSGTGGGGGVAGGAASSPADAARVAASRANIRETVDTETLSLWASSRWVGGGSARAARMASSSFCRFCMRPSRREYVGKCRAISATRVSCLMSSRRARSLSERLGSLMRRAPSWSMSPWRQAARRSKYSGQRRFRWEKHVDTGMPSMAASSTPLLEGFARATWRKRLA
ncbi:hypothetical protein H696_02587 [Fonticula alba]|uniref:Uncharacterized protein n=1 Tax=Fonticula alba TaxID=691883 RepID=A0A058Z9P6_FONAL|nr:hypothetical protein H696_02587 [Fonticula alba]KCV70257.1 hypothetical protein H696_02587 [Fonticula alba]|eukprot:XP_009494773.1 hypothetical protein H696_02587 [Fonticula alba]